MIQGQKSKPSSASLPRELIERTEHGGSAHSPVPNQQCRLRNLQTHRLESGGSPRCYDFPMVTEKGTPKIAYFCMEIALDQSMPTYGGGLGILAGDMLRSAADLELPMIAISLVYRKGYFRQRLDAEGNQMEEPDPWQPETVLPAVEVAFTVRIEDRDVHVRAWRYSVHGLSGFIVPVYLLDTDVPENSEYDRTLTDHSTAATSATASARKFCSALAASPCCAHLNVRRSAATT